MSVLLHHLERGGYRGRVMEGLGPALAAKPAAPTCDRQVSRLSTSSARFDDWNANRGAGILESLRNDPLFGTQASVLLDRKR